MLDTFFDYLRILLYLLLAAVAFFLFQAWEAEQLHKDNTTSHPERVAERKQDILLAKNNLQQAVLEKSPPRPETVLQTGSLIKVTTDVLEVSIDTKGGDIIEAHLLKYPETLGASKPFLLLNNESHTRYIAASGLLSHEGPDISTDQALYQAEQSAYQLSPDKNKLVIPLSWKKGNGLQVNKVYTFNRNSYEIDIAYEIKNDTNQIWEGNTYNQLMRTDSPPKSHSGLVNLATYFGAAISTPEQPFTKITFKELKEKNLNQIYANGWISMIQHYFISAWIPPKDSASQYYSHMTPNGLYTLGILGPTLKVPAYTTTTTPSSKLYAGPAIAERLEKAAPHLNLTIDYGWFWFLSTAIFWMMQKIYNVVGNWGWSIVLVTVIIKLLFFHLSAKSYRSMSALKNLHPKIEALKERYGNDRRKITQATLELYRQEKVNPMSGCLPILIQIPVFIALYWVIIESVELRQAPFIFWIKDLSQHDPYYILPILMGLSMFIQQRLSPPPADPLQAKILLFMPLIFTVLFANFPAGLMLYWFINNTLSFLQQWYIMQQIEKGPAARGKR